MAILLIIYNNYIVLLPNFIINNYAYCTHQIKVSTTNIVASTSPVHVAITRIMKMYNMYTLSLSEYKVASQ